MLVLVVWRRIVFWKNLHTLMFVERVWLAFDVYIRLGCTRELPVDDYQIVNYLAVVLQRSVNIGVISSPILTFIIQLTAFKIRQIGSERGVAVDIYH